MLDGLPFIKFFTLSAAMLSKRVRASLDAQAMCGVINVFFAVSSGLVGCGGSTVRTSAA